MSDTHTHYEELCMMAAARQLSPFDRRRLDEHLASCPSCSDFYRDMVTLAGAVAVAQPAGLEEPRTGKVVELVPSIVKRPVAELNGRGARRNWRSLAAASLACFACGWGAAHLVRQQAAAMHPVHNGAPAPAARADGTDAADLPPHTVAQNKTSNVAETRDQGDKLALSRLRAQYEEARTELASLRAKDQQSTLASEKLEAELATLRQGTATQTSLLAKLQAQLDQARSDHAQDAKLIALREDQLRQGLANAAAITTEAAEDRKQVEAFRLMGQRNLHVVDVYDNNNAGQRSSTFGRVFYSEGGPMMFVAFDLPGHGEADKTVYHAWGQTEGSSRKPLQLGTFAKDEGTAQRWVLRVNDASLLKQVDAVFITADRGNNVHTPNGPPLLYAYLRQVANHP